MSESAPESTPDAPDVQIDVEADQAVVNTAPDGGGVDNTTEAPAEKTE